MKNPILEMLGQKPFSFDEIFNEYKEYARLIKPYVCDTSVLLNEEIEHHKKILNEIKNCIDEEDNENKFNNTNDIEDGYYNPKVKKIKYKINFNPNIIKLLNYQKPVQAPVGKNKVNIYSDPVDIKKLRKYSKSNNSMKLNNSKYHHFISLSTETRREKEENVRNLKKNIVNILIKVKIKVNRCTRQHNSVSCHIKPFSIMINIQIIKFINFYFNFFFHCLNKYIIYRIN